MNNFRFISLLLVSIYCLLAISCEKDGSYKPDETNSNSPCQSVTKEYIRFKFVETCRDKFFTDTISIDVESFEFSTDSILTHTIYQEDGSTKSVNHYDLKKTKKELYESRLASKEKYSELLLEDCRGRYEDSLAIDSCFQEFVKLLGLDEINISLQSLVAQTTGRYIIDIMGDTTLIYYDTKRSTIPCPTSEITGVYRMEKDRTKYLYPYSVNQFIGPDTREYKLPLLPNDSLSTFVFESNERTDTLVFKYQVQEISISPECENQFTFERIELEKCTFESHSFSPISQYIQTSWK